MGYRGAMREARIVTVTPNPAVDWVFEAPGFGVGKHVLGRRVAQYPAGKGINVSRVLAALGARSVATGFIGRDELRMFEEHMERQCEGRVVCQLLVVRARTRDNISIVDPVDDTETHVRDQGFQVQPSDVARLESKVALLAREGIFLAFCGSLPPGLESEALLRMIGRAREAGARVVLDTGLRGLAAVRGERLWMVKVNAEELATLSGRPTGTWEEFTGAARSLAAAEGGTVDVVVATRGAEGAVLITEAAAFQGRVMVHPGRIVSTVGCGDSLLAGILSGWTNSGEWAEALREGLAAATDNATRREAGFVDPEGVQEFRQVAVIEPLG